MATNVIGLVVAIVVIVGVALWHRKEYGRFRRALNIPIGMAAFIAAVAIFYIVTGR